MVALNQVTVIGDTPQVTLAAYAGGVECTASPELIEAGTQAVRCHSQPANESIVIEKVSGPGSDSTELCFAVDTCPAD